MRPQARAEPAPSSRVWRAPQLPGLELLHARQQTQIFPRHTHEHYAVGVIEQGALGFYYRGENVVAASGEINLCLPGEVHTGQPAAERGWNYRMFYLEPVLLGRLVGELSGRAEVLPFVSSGVLRDASLARRLYGLHRLFEAPGVSLQRETRLLEVLGDLVQRYADAPPSSLRTGCEPVAVRQVKDYLGAHYAEDVTLAELAQLTQLSRYHLLRVFRDTVGVPPHAYLRQLRVERAKRALEEGQAIAQVALATGFADQSHLTRWFRRLWGYTPGHYVTGVGRAGHTDARAQ